MYSLTEMLKLYPTAISDCSFPEGVNPSTLRSTLMLCKGRLPVYCPDLFVESVRAWSVLSYDSIAKLVKIYKADYNPLENYDRIEDTEDTGHGISVGKDKAYDSGTLVEIGSSSSDSNTHRTSRVHGNIGVTTAAQMGQAESKWIANTDLYREIADSFSREICSPIFM